MHALTDLRDDPARTADHGHFQHEDVGLTHSELVEQAAQEIRVALAFDRCLIWHHGGKPGRPWPVSDQLYNTTGSHLEKLFADACAMTRPGSTFGQIGEAWWRWQQASIAALAKSIADHRETGGYAEWVAREVKQ